MYDNYIVMFGMVNNNTTDKSQHEKIVITGDMNEHIKKNNIFIQN